MDPRWEGDVRGHGIADGQRLSTEVDEFKRTMSSPGWVTEEPEAHLLPHLQRACARQDADFVLDASEVEADGTFVVRLHPRKALDIGQIRAALFSLLGQVAETVTYVRQRRTPADSTSDVAFDVATGIPSGDGPFAPHGHLLRFRIRPAATA